MKKHKIICLASATLAVTICLSACGKTNNPTSSLNPGNSTTVESSTPAPEGSTDLEDMVTPEDVAALVQDDSKKVTDRTLSYINNCNANWFNMYGERVGLVVVPSIDTGVSIDMVGEDYIEKMELTSKDSLLVINADTSDSLLMVGENSLLMGSNVLPNLEQGLELDDAIFNKYNEINEAYMSQQSSATTDGAGTDDSGSTQSSEGEPLSGPSEEDISSGEEIYKTVETVLSEDGLPGLIDITDIAGNSEAFPNSTIKETGDGNIKYQVLKGSTEDCDNYWFWYYNKITGEDTVLDEDGKTTFVQRFDPTNLYKHKSIAGSVYTSSDDGSSEQTYYRADCIGNVVVAASADPAYAGIIDSIFEEFGFPDTNTVY